MFIIILAYDGETESGFCSTSYMVRCIVEHSNYPILAEVHNR